MNTQPFHFKVADEVFTITLLEGQSPIALLPSFGPFLYKEELPANPLFELTLSPTPPASPDETGYEMIGDFDCGGCIHKIWRKQSDYLIHIYSVTNELACVLKTENSFTHCTASVHGNEDNQCFGLNNAIMIVFSFSAAPKGILMIHASVPCTDTKAYLFLGKSGTGKSTHCQLWLKHIEGTELLNDDNPALRILSNGEGTIVYGTPWSGKTPCYRNTQRQLGGILKLQQAPENVIQRMPPVPAMAEVLASCSTMTWDTDTYHHICQSVINIVKKTAVWHLRNLPNKEACRMSHQALTHGN